MEPTNSFTGIKMLPIKSYWKSSPNCSNNLILKKRETWLPWFLLFLTFVLVMWSYRGCSQRMSCAEGGVVEGGGVAQKGREKSDFVWLCGVSITKEIICVPKKWKMFFLISFQEVLGLKGYFLFGIYLELVKTWLFSKKKIVWYIQWK